MTYPYFEFRMIWFLSTFQRYRSVYITFLFIWIVTVVLSGELAKLNRYLVQVMEFFNHWKCKGCRTDLHRQNCAFADYKKHTIKSATSNVQKATLPPCQCLFTVQRRMGYIFLSATSKIYNFQVKLTVCLWVVVTQLTHDLLTLITCEETRWSLSSAPLCYWGLMTHIRVSKHCHSWFCQYMACRLFGT